MVEEPRGGGGSPAGDTAADRSAADAADDEAVDAGPGLSVRTKLVAGVVALVVAGFAVASLAGGGGSKKSDDTAAVDAAGSDAAGSAAANNSAGAIDMFDRADGKLGVSGSGDTWSMQNGTWAVVGGQAAVTDKAADRRTLATIDTGAADGSLDVVLAVVRPQCGVVFRMRGPVDYLALLAVPDLGTWNLVRVGLSGPVAIGNIGQAPVKDGTRVHVELSGADVTVAVGNARRQFVVPELIGATKAGLVCGGPLENAQAARFTDFVYLPAASVGAGSTAVPGAAGSAQTASTPVGSTAAATGAASP